MESKIEHQMEYQNLRVIGTSHIAKESLDEVKRAVEGEKPDIIALELDKKRLYALMGQEKKRIKFRNILKVGFKGFLFSLIGEWAEKKLGEYAGVMPGSEMKQAVRLSRKYNIKLALIDQDIDVTLKRLSDSLTWREKWNFIADVFKAVVLRKRGSEFEFDLRTVPSQKIIKKLVREVKERYPNVYRVLIEERNEVMAKRLVRLMKADERRKILAVVGAGHEEEIIGLIEMIMHKSQCSV